MKVRFEVSTKELAERYLFWKEQYENNPYGMPSIAKRDMRLLMHIYSVKITDRTKKHKLEHLESVPEHDYGAWIEALKKISQEEQKDGTRKINYNK